MSAAKKKDDAEPTVDELHQQIAEDVEPVTPEVGGAELAGQQLASHETDRMVATGGAAPAPEDEESAEDDAEGDDEAVEDGDAGDDD